MHRRRFLAVAAATGAAGCVGVRPGYRGGDELPGQEQGTSGSETRTVAGTALPVEPTEMRHPLPRDAIPAIVDPAFAPDWRGLDAPPDAETPPLPVESPVVGVERDGRARAYPLRVLNWHEVVNDTLDGPLLVTYCPLCGSAVVASRRVSGQATTFGVSGRLWREDLVLYDERTESLWSQLAATAIHGPRTGDRLRVQPSRLTSWGEWRAEHPDGVVLLPPPHSNTVSGRSATFTYFRGKYGYEDEPGLVGYSLDEDDRRGDQRLHSREFVLGIEHRGQARAYPFAPVAEAGVVNDRLAGLPIAVTTTPGESMTAWVRVVGGPVLTFEPAGTAHIRAGDSHWKRVSGVAVDGPHEGTVLERANDDPPMFWTGWRNFHPDTTVYGR